MKGMDAPAKYGTSQVRPVDETREGVTDWSSRGAHTTLSNRTLVETILIKRASKGKVMRKLSQSAGRRSL